jgi:hypothetical protein
MNLDTRVDQDDIAHPLNECGGFTDEEGHWAQSQTRLKRLVLSTTPGLLIKRISLFHEVCRIQFSESALDALTIEVSKATLAPSAPLLHGNVQPPDIKSNCGTT